MIRGSKPWWKLPSGGSEFSLSANKLLQAATEVTETVCIYSVSKVDPPLCRAMLASTPKAHESILGSAGADPRNAGIAVGRIAHECEQVRNERRIDAELFAYRNRIANRFAPAVDLYHARTSHALRQIFIGRPDGDFLDLFVLRREMRGRSERIIGFEVDHRPDDYAHRNERLLERMELSQQRGLNAGAGLVARPKPIP